MLTSLVCYATHLAERQEISEKSCNLYLISYYTAKEDTRFRHIVTVPDRSIRCKDGEKVQKIKQDKGNDQTHI